MAENFTPEELKELGEFYRQMKANNDPDADAMAQLIKSNRPAENPMGNVPVKLEDGRTLPFSELATQVSPTGATDEGFLPALFKGAMGMQKAAMQAMPGMAPLGEIVNRLADGGLEDYIPTMYGNPKASSGAQLMNATQIPQFIEAMAAQFGEFGKAYASLGKPGMQVTVPTGGFGNTNFNFPLESVGHLAAGLLPGLGPMAAKAGESLGKGATGQGAAEAFLTLAPFAVPFRGPTKAAISQERADNLSAALEMGGKAPKGIRVNEDVAAPIADDLISQMTANGRKPADFKGREGYRIAEEEFGKLRESYDAAYETNLIDPIRATPSPATSQAAAREFLNGIRADADFMNIVAQNKNATRFVKGLAQDIAQKRTIGEIDQLRKDLNTRNSKYFESTEAQAAGQAFVKQALGYATDAIRGRLYEDMVKLHAPSPNFNVPAIREFQRRHGAAIRADRMMADTGTEISRQASIEGSPAPLIDRLAAVASPTTYSSPLHAAGGTVKAVISPSQVRAFNVRMARLLEGSKQVRTIKVPK